MIFEHCVCIKYRNDICGNYNLKWVFGVKIQIVCIVHTSLCTVFIGIFYCFCNRCPDITRLYTLSEPSVNGIPLYVLEITDNPGKHELSKTLKTDDVIQLVNNLFFSGTRDEIHCQHAWK